MSGRELAIVTPVNYGHGDTRRYTQVECARCHSVQRITVKSNAHSTVPAIVVKSDSKVRGWRIGPRPSDDVCPECLKIRKSQEMSAKKSEVELANVIQITPPREMTRDNRRIIFLKLEEVYIDETTGYDRGWSDKRVAEDLGVPRAWVQEIRDQNFGPAKDSDDVREMMASFEALSKAAEGVASKSASLLREATSLSTEVGAIKAKLTELTKAVDQIKRATV